MRGGDFRGLGGARRRSESLEAGKGGRAREERGGDRETEGGRRTQGRGSGDYASVRALESEERGGERVREARKPLESPREARKGAKRRIRTMFHIEKPKNAR